MLSDHFVVVGSEMSVEVGGLESVRWCAGSGRSLRDGVERTKRHGAEDTVKISLVRSGDNESTTAVFKTPANRSTDENN